MNRFPKMHRIQNVSMWFWPSEEGKLQHQEQVDECGQSRWNLLRKDTGARFWVGSVRHTPGEGNESRLAKSRKGEEMLLRGNPRSFCPLCPVSSGPKINSIWPYHWADEVQTGGGRRRREREREGGVVLYSNRSFFPSFFSFLRNAAGMSGIVPYLINNSRRRLSAAQAAAPDPAGCAGTTCVLCIVHEHVYLRSVEPIVSGSVIIMQQFPLAGVRGWGGWGGWGGGGISIISCSTMKSL